MQRLIIFLMVISSIEYSCRKELKCGCTIKTDTVNYDADADCDDGSCIFISEINILPDSVEEYPVDIFIDDSFRTHLKKIGRQNSNNPFFWIGYIEKFPSNEVHRYRVEDSFGMVWEGTFSTDNEFGARKPLLLIR